jgi:hypothetical protein
MDVGGGNRSRNDGAVTKRATANYTGRFANTSTNVTITNVRRFILCQRIEAAVGAGSGGSYPTKHHHGEQLPPTATFRDNLAQVTFDRPMTGIVT